MSYSRKRTNEKLQAEANSVGLEVVGDGRDYTERLYRFLSCGHETYLKTGNVRLAVNGKQGKYTCRDCIADRHKIEADEAGLIFIGHGKTSYFRKYKFKSCGHEQEIAVSAVRSGFFKCFTCGSTAHNQPSNLYVNVITMDGYSTVKVGIAKNLDRRIAEYKLQRRCDIHTALVISFGTGRGARESELEVKRKFRDFVDPMAREIMTSNGHTECFLIDKFEEILEFCKKMKT